MGSYAELPLFSDVADWYAYPVLTASINTPAVVINQPGATQNGYITLANQYYFAAMGFVVQTNYDNVGGVFASAVSDAILATNPTTPNTFNVKVDRGDRNTFSNLPLTQAELCSAGLFSGKQYPLPVIYWPTETLTFLFADLTGLYLLESDESQEDLAIKMFLVGYKIPFNDEAFRRFLEYFPELKPVYLEGKCLEIPQ